jgi:carbohydrate-selective porin OprB
MGSYREALAAYARGTDPVPDIEAHRRQGRVKYGAGANVEYTTDAGLRAFGRVGWNSGDTESFAYTEVNDTLSIGADLGGSRWRRAGDRVGVAFVSNGLSAGHRAYLHAGGLGFLLGDGTLTYGREAIVESYYTAHVWRGLFGSIGGQLIDHPGYNRDRGPVAVASARVHVDF